MTGAVRPLARRGGPAASGFTLVELLVVLTILGLVVGLVAGIGVDRLERAQARDERVALRRTFESLAFQAFAHGRTIRIVADGKELSYEDVDGVRRLVEMRYWFSAPGQRIEIGPNGIAQPAFFEIRRGADDVRVELNGWLGDPG